MQTITMNNDDGHDTFDEGGENSDFPQRSGRTMTSAIPFVSVPDVRRGLTELRQAWDRHSPQRPICLSDVMMRFVNYDDDKCILHHGDADYACMDGGADDIHQDDMTQLQRVNDQLMDDAPITIDPSRYANNPSEEYRYIEPTPTDHLTYARFALRFIMGQHRKRHNKSKRGSGSAAKEAKTTETKIKKPRKPTTTKRGNKSAS